VFGVKAVVIKQWMSAITVMWKKEVKSTGIMQEQHYPCDIGDITPWEEEAMQPKKAKSIAQLTAGEKRFMVKQIWGNSKGTLISSMKNQMLADEDLHAIFEYLQWQYQMPEFAMIRPGAVKVACYEGMSSPEGVSCVFEMKDMMEKFKYVVLPIHASLHWTVLLLIMEEGDTGKVKEVYYFDFLPTVQLNLQYARKILRMLTVDGAGGCMEVPAVHNSYRQSYGSNDCGFAVWYALEVFMKQHRLEGKWTLYPVPSVWRERLHTLKTTLLEQQQAWILEVGMGTKPKVKITLPGDKITDKKAYDKEVSELWKAGTLKHKPKDFFTCSKCRWSTSGEGCYACNPKKGELVKDDRQKQVQQLRIALEKGLEICKLKGLLKEPVPEDEIVKDKDKLLQGGGIDI
jgi:hypothetical protein